MNLNPFAKDRPDAPVRCTSCGDTFRRDEMSVVNTSDGRVVSGMCRRCITGGG